MAHIPVWTIEMRETGAEEAGRCPLLHAGAGTGDTACRHASVPSTSGATARLAAVGAACTPRTEEWRLKGNSTPGGSALAQPSGHAAGSPGDPPVPLPPSAAAAAQCSCPRGHRAAMHPLPCQPEASFPLASTDELVGSRQHA